MKSPNTPEITWNCLWDKSVGTNGNLPKHKTTNTFTKNTCKICNKACLHNRVIKTYVVNSCNICHIFHENVSGRDMGRSHFPGRSHFMQSQHLSLQN